MYRCGLGTLSWSRISSDSPLSQVGVTLGSSAAGERAADRSWVVRMLDDYGVARRIAVLLTAYGVAR